MNRLLLASALLLSAPAFAGDPLDDVSGTEGWDDKTRGPRHRRRATDDLPVPEKPPASTAAPAQVRPESSPPPPVSRDAAENAADHERYKAERREFDAERDQSVAIKKGRIGSFFRAPPVIETVKQKPKAAPKPKADTPEATLDDEERRLEEKANRALAGQQDGPPAPRDAEVEPEGQPTAIKPARQAPDRGSPDSP